jgi:hypothetical protein
MSVGAFRTIRYATVPLWPRFVNIALGLWLFASAFLLPHQGNTRFNDWMIGLLVASTALSAVWAPAMRWANTYLAVALAFWALVLEYSSRVTRVHDLVVAGLIFVVSLVPGDVPEEIAV